MVRRVAVVPHTHWDREWYAPFEQFRHQLVGVVGEVLDLLDEGTMEGFLLDGQVAVVDDHLAVRPGDEERIRRHAAAGRLTIGPWYILMDEFCVSGETIVRNLQRGHRRATELGATPEVGYLPDMFGHIAQMPQILRLAGLGSAVVWRGVPRSITRSGFWWRAPDGSSVRAEYLPVGYGIGAHLPTDPGDLLHRIEAEEQELAPFLRTDDSILLLNGSDHQHPQPGIGRAVADADGLTTRYEISVTTLPAYLRDAPTEALPGYAGELRSSARTNLLAGVLSNRTDIKVATARAERALERVAEPLAALWLDTWPEGDLDEAWLQLIRNSAHDSICACSADSVGHAVIARVDTTQSLAGVVTEDALAAAAAAIGASGPVALNPGARARRALLEVTRPGVDVPPGTQLLDRWPGGRERRTGRGADLHRIIGELRRDGRLGHHWGSDLLVRRTDDSLTVTFTDDRAAAPSDGLRQRLADAFVQAGAARDEPLEVVVESPPSVRVLATVADVPGFGWKAWSVDDPAPTPVEATAGTLDNGLVRVDVDPAEGTFSLSSPEGGVVSGLGRLVDDGDDGDTYTYAPPLVDVVVDRPVAVAVTVVETGPVRAALQVTTTYRWPERVCDGQRCGGRDVVVTTTLELRAGETMVRVAHAWDNPCRDHRVRAAFPLPRRATTSTAECAFGTVTRTLEPEPGDEEVAVATYPSRRFVTAGGLTVTHEGLLEYEVTGDGSALALTLLRATGLLAKPAPPTRPNPAGPAHPLAGPQMIGPVECRYAVAIDVADPYAMADEAWTELPVAWAAGTGELADEGRWLEVDGAEVSSLRRVDDRIELRLFNPSPDAVMVRLGDRAGAVVDLLGEELDTFKRQVPLRPWAIATLLIDP